MSRPRPTKPRGSTASAPPKPDPRTLDNPCLPCKGGCCQHVAIPIDTPTTPGDFDDIRWYLLHDNVRVFVEDGDWYCEFKTRCSALQTDWLCAIYEKRPKICRDYDAESCEYYGENDADDAEPSFETVEEIEAYAREFLAEKRRKAARRRRHKHAQHARRKGGA